MSQLEASNKYAQALKAGQKTYRECVLKGRYPYLQILDEILSDSMVAGQVDLGVIDIPADQIVGTKTVGRRTAFAADFMPLLAPDTEFASKWVNLCAAHLSEEGIRDPIRCYEYMGRFYVQEGNKRVSVLKSFDAPSIPGYVTRVIPAYSEDTAVRIYYEFLSFYRLSGIYQVYFSRLGGFAKLQAALGFDPDHVWTEEERRRFLAGFYYFKEAFIKLGGRDLHLTPADALLVWLQVYPIESVRKLPLTDIGKNLAAMWSDVKAAAQAEPIAVSTAPEVSHPKSLISRLFGSVLLPNHLDVAFINRPDPVHSNWITAHDLGRQAMEQALSREVTVRSYNLKPGDDVDTAMEQAVADGAQVLFATTAPLISSCRKLAVRHPEVHILNCSVAMPYPGVRTYYSRIYEGKFITGAIAGAMARGDRIGYIASNPIFGVPASINAFALGARLTNPRAKILLSWSCVSEDPIGDLLRQGVDIISNRDIPTPDQPQGNWGLSQVGPAGDLIPLAPPYWDWGNFYVRLVSTILHGDWDALNYKDSGKAVNYWWGMSSGVVGLHLTDNLPDGVRHLANILCHGIIDNTIYPFHRQIRSQDGTVRNDGNQWFSPEEVLHMDWLCDCVEGGIPDFDQLLPMSRSIVRLQGVYRDQIPPEKEGSAK